MSQLKQKAKTAIKYQINIFHTRPDFTKNIVFLRRYYAQADDREELLRIFYHAFEQAHPDWTIKTVEAVII